MNHELTTLLKNASLNVEGGKMPEMSPKAAKRRAFLPPSKSQLFHAFERDIAKISSRWQNGMGRDLPKKISW